MRGRDGCSFWLGCCGWGVAALLVVALVGVVVRGQVYLTALGHLPRSVPRPAEDSFAQLVALGKEVPRSDEVGLGPNFSTNDRLNSCGLAQYEAYKPFVPRILALRGRPCMVPDEGGPDDATALDRVRLVLATSAQGKRGAGDHQGGTDDALALAEFCLRLSAWAKADVSEKVLQSAAAELRAEAYRVDGATATRVSRRLEQLLCSVPSGSQRVRNAAPTLLFRSMSAGTGLALSPESRGRSARRRTVGQQVVPLLLERVRCGLRPSFARHRAQVTAHIEQFAVEMDKPYSQQKPPNGARRFSLVEWGTRFRLSSQSCTQQLLLAEMALAAYHADHGEFPDRLEQVTPKYLLHVPRDPYGTGPLGYRREEGRYRCWSVGPDGRDDGGKPPSSSGSLATDAWHRLRDGIDGDMVVFPDMRRTTATTAAKGGGAWR